MNKSNKYSPEVRERAVRMVQEARKDYPSQWAAVESIAPKIGCAAVTLHEWVKKHEIDSGIRDGIPSAERERIKTLEREVKELRQANEILRLASAFSPRRSSTASRRNKGFHRPAPGSVRGRADLQAVAGCSVRLLAPCRPATRSLLAERTSVT